MSPVNLAMVTDEILFNLATAVGEHLQARGLTLAVAESCTGGLLGHWITEVPGSSHYFVGGIIAYSNEVKQRLLGVPETVLEQHGAVSRPCAQAMARGVRERCQAHLGISVTGIAGPSGGTVEKPVGLTYIHLAAPEGDWWEAHRWTGNRTQNKRASVAAALQLLYRYLQGELTAE